MQCSRMPGIFSCSRGEPDDEEVALTSHVTSKVVVVGDGAVGKTSLLMRFVTDEFDERYQPTIFENQAAPVMVKKKKVMLNLFDTAGQEGYEHLRPFMYPETDVILICFAVNSPSSLSNVVEKWQPEVRLHLAKVPVLLLGLKTDLRSVCSVSDGDGARSPQASSSTSDGCVNGNTDSDAEVWSRRMVTYSEGQKVAADIGAKAYFECSAKLNEGLTPIFQEAARMSLKYRRRSSLRNLLSPRPSFV